MSNINKIQDKEESMSNRLLFEVEAVELFPKAAKNNKIALIDA